MPSWGWTMSLQEFTCTCLYTTTIWHSYWWVMKLGVHDLAGLWLGFYFGQETVQLAYGVFVWHGDAPSIYWTMGITLDLLLCRSILFVLCTYWNVSQLKYIPANFVVNFSTSLIALDTTTYANSPSDAFLAEGSYAFIAEQSIAKRCTPSTRYATKFTIWHCSDLDELLLVGR